MGLLGFLNSGALGDPEICFLDELEKYSRTTAGKEV
jgi:hypothetical protein